MLKIYWSEFQQDYVFVNASGLYAYTFSSLGFLGFHYCSVIDLEFICEVTDET